MAWSNYDYFRSDLFWAGVTVKSLVNDTFYRFNHRNEDIFPLIINMLKKTEYNEIQSILARIR